MIRRSEIKMTLAERANQNATSGSESEKPACASADSARDLELSGPRPDSANEDFDRCA